MTKMLPMAGAAAIVAALTVAACSDPLGSSCEVVTGGNTRIQITNATGSGLDVDFTDFAFGALMRPGACEIFGVPSVTLDLDLTRCTFVGDSECQHTGQTVSRTYTLTANETLAVTIDGSFF